MMGPSLQHYLFIAIGCLLILSSTSTFIPSNKIPHEITNPHFSNLPSSSPETQLIRSLSPTTTPSPTPFPSPVILDSPVTSATVVFLGHVGSETSRFRSYCKEECKKASGISCTARSPGNPLPLCNAGRNLGFATSSTCCFWSSCFNKYGVPSSGGVFREVFWRITARRRSCSF